MRAHRAFGDRTPFAARASRGESGPAEAGDEDEPFAAVAPWWDPGRRGAGALACAVLLAIVVTAVWVVAVRPRSTAVSVAAFSPSALARGAGGRSGPAVAPSSPSPAPAAPASASASASASAPAEVVVDVAGKVRSPGVHRLPAGTRVADALEAAGGALPGVDLSTIDLAALLRDGEQIAVGVPGAPAQAAANAAVAAPGSTRVATGGSATGGSASAPVDVNAASFEQLQTLPGVGPVLAQHILDWRTAHGRFTSIAQLEQVPGIGPAKLATLKSAVVVSP